MSKSYLEQYDVSHPKLEQDCEVDVCVVGSGYTGLSTAYHLAKLGKSVVVLESNQVASGASGNNAGQVCFGQRHPQSKLEEKYGSITANLLWESSVNAVNLVKSLIIEHGIDCNYKDGVLFVATNRSHAKAYELEADILSSRYDYPSLSYLERDEVTAIVGSDRFYGGILDNGSGHLKPLEFALGLASAACDAGATIFEDSAVTRFYPKNNKVYLQANGKKVVCDNLVVACNGYASGLSQGLSNGILPVYMYIGTTEPIDSVTFSSLLQEDLAVQSSAFLKTYWRQAGNNCLEFAGAGTLSPLSSDAQITRRLRDTISSIYPEIGRVGFTDIKRVMAARTASMIPSFGKLGSHTWFAQGYSGQGIPLSVLAGEHIARGIMGDTRDFELFSHLPVNIRHRRSRLSKFAQKAYFVAKKILD